MDAINHEYTSEIVCPWCGYEFGDSWDIGPEDEDIGQIECEECERAFTANRNISVSYSTQKCEYGECAECGADGVVLTSMHSSLGSYSGLCEKCGRAKYKRFIDRYAATMNVNDPECGR